MLYILVTSSDISVSSSRKVIDDNKPCKYDFIFLMSSSQQGSGYGEIPHQIGLTLKKNWTKSCLVKEFLHE